MTCCTNPITVRRKSQEYIRSSSNVADGKEVDKGTWWMPRLSEAMKDVISCEKPR